MSYVALGRGSVANALPKSALLRIPAETAMDPWGMAPASSAWEPGRRVGPMSLPVS
ncbi:hypothetical protein GCM10010431_53460 [Streptomyces kunmingensis]